MLNYFSRGYKQLHCRKFGLGHSYLFSVAIECLTLVMSDSDSDYPQDDSPTSPPVRPSRQKVLLNKYSGCKLDQLDDLQSKFPPQLYYSFIVWLARLALKNKLPITDINRELS